MAEIRTDIYLKQLFGNSCCSMEIGEGLREGLGSFCYRRKEHLHLIFKLLTMGCCLRNENRLIEDTVHKHTKGVLYQVKKQMVGEDITVDVYSWKRFLKLPASSSDPDGLQAAQHVCRDSIFLAKMPHRWPQHVELMLDLRLAWYLTRLAVLGESIVIVAGG